MPNPKGNPNIADAYAKSTGPITDVGKFRTSLNSYTGNDTNESRQRKIPQEVKNLYVWFKNLTKEDREFLFEMQGIYDILKVNIQNSGLRQKVESGELLTRAERDQINMMMEALEKAHKMKYGEKRVNINADLKDIRDYMFDEPNTRNQ